MSKLLTYFECDSDVFGQIMSVLGPFIPLVQNFRVEAANGGEKKPETLYKVSPRTPGLTRKKGYKGSPAGSGEVRDWKRSTVAHIIHTAVEKAGGKATYQVAKDALSAEGYNPSSHTAGLTVLRRNGIIRTQGDIIYLLNQEDES